MMTIQSKPIPYDSPHPPHPSRAYFDMPIRDNPIPRDKPSHGAPIRFDKPSQAPPCRAIPTRHPVSIRAVTTSPVAPFPGRPRHLHPTFHFMPFRQTLPCHAEPARHTGLPHLFTPHYDKPFRAMPCHLLRRTVTYRSQIEPLRLAMPPQTAPAHPLPLRHFVPRHASLSLTTSTCLPATCLLSSTPYDVPLRSGSAPSDIPNQDASGPHDKPPIAPTRSPFIISSTISYR